MSVSNISVDVSYVFLSTGVSRINTFNADWYVITSNSTCQYLAAANNFNIHISSNYGGTWNQTTIPDNITFSGITIDSSGKYMAACSGSNGIIYISNNYGTSWSQITNTQIPFIASRYGWNSITSDSTGKYLVVCGINYSSGGNYIFSGVEQIAFSTIGDGLNNTESINLNTRITAFQTALSRNV